MKEDSPLRSSPSPAETGDAAATAAGAPSAASPQDDLVVQVSAELDALPARKKSWFQNIGALALTLVLFVSLGLLRNSPAGIGILAGVVGLHECGHLLGMKLLRYKDLQMFFIPLFGGAVTGVDPAPSGAKKAAISLLGPVPGILIGIVSGLAYLKTRQPWLADATRALLFLNTFNLLPFHPFDGARVLDAVLLSRHPRLETGFRLITTLLLGGLALALRDAFLGLFAVMVLMSLRSAHLAATIAHALRAQLDEQGCLPPEKVPAPCVRQIVDRLKARLPAPQCTPRLLAARVSDIWERVRNRPCPVLPAVGLLFAHVAAVLVGATALFVFAVLADSVQNSKTEIVTRPLPSGEVVRVEVVTLRGRTISEVQLNEEGLFDGPAAGWHAFSAQKSEAGQWRNGFWHGEWQFWDGAGRLTKVVEFDMGTPVRYSQVVDGQLRELPRAEWPRSYKRLRQPKPQRAQSHP